MVAFHIVLDPGDEAVFSLPAWFCYEPLLIAASATAHKIALQQPSFDLDLDAMDAAIRKKTRLVILNTPHNPTGRIYSRAALEKVAELLERASNRIGHRIYLLSDEPYRRLRFDGNGFVSPASIYPWTLISYSYGKVLLAPGQRLGYLAISPLMPALDRKAFSESMLAAQMSLGWCFPNAVMQYAVPDLENLSIDQTALARRKDRLMGILAESGFETLSPEGTFYLWSKWPKGNPEQLWNDLADRDVFVMPGSLLGTADYLRLSLTATDEMVERARPAFLAVGRAHSGR